MCEWEERRERRIHSWWIRFLYYRMCPPALAPDSLLQWISYLSFLPLFIFYLFSHSLSPLKSQWKREREEYRTAICASGAYLWYFDCCCWRHDRMERVVRVKGYVSAGGHSYHLHITFQPQYSFLCLSSQTSDRVLCRYRERERYRKGIYTLPLLPLTFSSPSLQPSSTISVYYHSHSTTHSPRTSFHFEGHSLLCFTSFLWKSFDIDLNLVSVFQTVDIQSFHFISVSRSGWVLIRL